MLMYFTLLLITVKSLLYTPAMIIFSLLWHKLLAHILNCLPQFSSSLELPSIDVYTTLSDGVQVFDRAQVWNTRQPGHQAVILEANLGKVGPCETCLKLDERARAHPMTKTPLHSMESGLSLNHG